MADLTWSGEVMLHALGRPQMLTMFHTIVEKATTNLFHVLARYLSHFH